MCYLHHDEYRSRMDMKLYKRRVRALVKARKNASNPEFKELWHTKLTELYLKEYQIEKRG